MHVKITVVKKRSQGNANPYNSILKIEGVVTGASIKLPCTVSIFERLSSMLIDTVLTDVNGNYEFGNLDSRFSYFVVALDSEKKYNAVIQDNLVPK